MAEKSRIAELIYLQLRNKLSPDEERELRAWMDESEANRQFVEKRMDAEGVAKGMETFLAMDKNAMRRKFDKRCLEAGIKIRTHRIIPLRWQRVAAVLIGVCITCGGYYCYRLLSEKKIFNLTAEVTERPKLILNDGATVFLDEVERGNGIVVDGYRICRTDSQSIVYSFVDDPGEKDGKQCYHAIYAPYEQTWNVTLPDHTSIDLNSGSSMMYSLMASSTKPYERNVRLYGEAYFRVASNPRAPFIVSTGTGRVEVLSTVFDVQDYPKENKLVVKVIEGAINARRGNNNCKVEKGYSAEFNPLSNGKWKIALYDSSDLSWRTNFFDFTHLNLRQSMEELARWYGKEVVILPGVDTMSQGILRIGTIRKGADIKKILPYLGESCGIYLHLEGRKIIASASASP